MVVKRNSSYYGIWSSGRNLSLITAHQTHVRTFPSTPDLLWWATRVGNGQLFPSGTRYLQVTESYSEHSYESIHLGVCVRTRSGARALFPVLIITHPDWWEWFRPLWPSMMGELLSKKRDRLFHYRLFSPFKSSYFFPPLCLTEAVSFSTKRL